MIIRIVLLIINTLDASFLDAIEPTVLQCRNKFSLPPIGPT